MTNANQTWFWLLSLSMTCLFYACTDKETGIPTDSVFTSRNLLGCDNYESHQIVPPNSQEIKEVAKLNNFFIYASGSVLIVKDGIAGTVVLEKDIDITHKLLVHNNRVLVCAQDGIFEIDEALNFTQKSNASCLDMNLNSEEEVLFTTLGFGTNEPDKIYELTPQNTVEPFTNAYDRQGLCITLLNFRIVGNSIWAFNCYGELVVFENGLYSRTYNASNVETWGGTVVVPDGFFILPHRDDLFVVSKNGTAYLILKYSAGSWTVFKNFREGEPPSEKDQKMRVTDIHDAIIHEDKLLIATREGVQEFDLLATLPLQDADYAIIQDPEFPSQWISSFYKASETEVYLLTIQRTIISMDCF